MVVTLAFYVPVHDAIICHAVSGIEFGWFDESVHFSGHIFAVVTLDYKLLYFKDFISSNKKYYICVT